MKRVFITGITGLLGGALVEENKKRLLCGIYKGPYKMSNTGYTTYINADILDDSIFEIFQDYKIDCIIHTAGVADTDICEDEKFYKTAYISNIKGTENMIEFARRKKAKLVYISTNAVFDGENAPYQEEDRPNPINRYGAIKLECEHIVRKTIENSLIIRPILMYGLNNPNERKSFFNWVIEKLQHEERANVVDDVFENPLLSYYCARVIWKLIDRDASGIYHIAGRDILSRYEAAKIAAKVFSLDENLINPVSSSFFKNLAPRPRNTSYSTAKIERELDEKPLGFAEGLMEFKRRILSRIPIVE